eukprot:349898-Chlamydomonas_euryale.AAC.9
MNITLSPALLVPTFMSDLLSMSATAFFLRRGKNSYAWGCSIVKFCTVLVAWEGLAKQGGEGTTLLASGRDGCLLHGWELQLLKVLHVQHALLDDRLHALSPAARADGGECLEGVPQGHGCWRWRSLRWWRQCFARRTGFCSCGVLQAVEARFEA